MSQLYFPPQELHQIVTDTLVTVSKNKNWRDRSPLSPLLQIIVFNHSFVMSKSTLNSVIALVITLLKDSQIEVGEAAKRALSSLIRITGTQIIDDYVETFTKAANTKLPRKKDLKTREGDEALASRQMGILGLAAFVESQPYGIPSWLPSVVVEVADHLNDPHPIKKTASDCMKEFWRTHQDEWIFEKEKFTQDQIDAITQTTAPSYFA